jgi:uncharacterized protein with von Willebrand factor type A (vWA) domain
MKPLEERIVEFGHRLRRFGINVTHSEITDALKAVSLVGIAYDDFYAALSCTLIKERADMNVFHTLFRICFNVKPDGPPQEDSGDPLEDSGNQGYDGRESGRVEAGNTPGVVTEQRMKSRIEGEPYLLLVQAVKEGDYDMLQELAHQAVKNIAGIRHYTIDDAQEMVKKAQNSIGWEKAMDELFEGLLSARAFFF